MKVNELLQSGKYLPPFLRDFHAQKDVFKYVWDCVERRKATEPDYRSLDGMSWCSAHIYVIDFFLWAMALHGWTLQRSRLKCEDFKDIHQDVQALKDEMTKAAMAEWTARRKYNSGLPREPGEPQP